MKPKFFSQISDYQQRMFIRPLQAAYLIPPALLEVADSIHNPPSLFSFRPKSRDRPETEDSFKFLSR